MMGHAIRFLIFFVCFRSSTTFSLHFRKIHPLGFLICSVEKEKNRDLSIFGLLFLSAPEGHIIDGNLGGVMVSTWGVHFDKAGVSFPVYSGLYCDIVIEYIPCLHDKVKLVFPSYC